jgi:hypothetical protein
VRCSFRLFFGYLRSRARWHVEPCLCSAFISMVCAAGTQQQVPVVKLVSSSSVLLLAQTYRCRILVPSAGAMRKLLNMCDNYANGYHILFNAENSKCLTFLSESRRNLSEHTGLSNGLIRPVY